MPPSSPRLESFTTSTKNGFCGSFLFASHFLLPFCDCFKLKQLACQYDDCIVLITFHGGICVLS